MESINDTLLKLQNGWIREVVNPFLQAQQKERFSKPFHLGLPDQLRPNRKLIMLIGQEARNFVDFGDGKDTAESIQQWCIQRLTKELSDGGSHTSSPFWNFARRLYNHPDDKAVNVCWNNLDKLHRCNLMDGCAKARTFPLKYEHEKLLSRQYGPDSKSLLQREIEAVCPNALVFLTGPQYAVSMCCAFGLEPHALDAFKPTRANFVKRIDPVLNLQIPAFWTYHPRYLSFNPGFTAEAVHRIINGTAN